MDLIKEYAVIQKKINNLTSCNKPINPDLYRKQLQIVETLDDQFIKSGEENIEIYKVRIRYNVMMKYFAEKLGLSVDKYNAKIAELSRKMGIPEGE